LTLDETIQHSVNPSGPTHEAAERFRALRLADLFQMEEREYQLALEPAPSMGLSVIALASAATELLARPPALPLKVVTSAHSIDIVPRDSTKTLTLEKVEARTAAPALAIGDQGQVGGNDFELLAATRWSLSVDRVSGDLTRCWNLDQRGGRGPDLLIRYLTALEPKGTQLTFRWKN
jgi:hypothetical protein